MGFAEDRHGRAADVLDLNIKLAQGLVNCLRFLLERGWPGRVVRDHSDTFHIRAML